LLLDKIFVDYNAQVSAVGSVVEECPERDTAHGEVKGHPKRMVHGPGLPELLALVSKRRPVKGIVVPMEMVEMEVKNLPRCVDRKKDVLANVSGHCHPSDPVGIAIDRHKLRVAPVLVAAAPTVRIACLDVAAPGQKFDRSQNGCVVALGLFDSGRVSPRGDCPTIFPVSRSTNTAVIAGSLGNQRSL
jgi:hypothetical protein